MLLPHCHCLALVPLRCSPWFQLTPWQQGLWCYGYGLDRLLFVVCCIYGYRRTSDKRLIVYCLLYPQIPTWHGYSHTHKGPTGPFILDIGSLRALPMNQASSYPSFSSTHYTKPSDSRIYDTCNLRCLLHLLPQSFCILPKTLRENGSHISGEARNSRQGIYKNKGIFVIAIPISSYRTLLALTRAFPSIPLTRPAGPP
jgi:hypothetical protein